MTLGALISLTEVPEGIAGPMHTECYSLFGHLGPVLDIQRCMLAIDAVYSSSAVPYYQSIHQLSRLPGCSETCSCLRTV